MQRILLIFLLLLSQLVSAQTNLYVDSSRATSGAGTSWATAYKTLNEALDLANNASTTVSYNVYVAKGTYYPTGTQSGTNRDSSFAMLRNGLRVYGGYPSGGGAKSTTANPTILSGDIGVAGSNTDNSYHVLVIANASAVGDSVILDGVTVAYGTANGGSSRTYGGQTVNRAYGGGIWMGAVDSNSKVRNCVFYKNSSSGGGAIYLLNASTSFWDNVFQMNQASLGGAVYAEVANGNFYTLTTRQCYFENNTANAGGAFYVKSYGSTGFKNCNFISNGIFPGSSNTTASGGAIYAENSFSLNQCAFTQNKALNGGAIYAIRGIRIDSSSFAENRATTGNGGAIYYTTPANIAYLNPMDCYVSTFEKNTALLGNGGAVFGQGSQYYRRCVFTKDSARRGGGIYNIDRGVVLDTSRLTENYASGRGGAIYGHNCAVDLRNDTLRYNRADTAGGALVGYSNSDIIRSVLSLNTAGQQGGAAVLYGSTINNDISVQKAVFSGNAAGQQGGAMVIYAKALIENSLFSGNTAGQQGGAMALLNCNPMLENVTLAGDSALSGNGLYCNAASPIIKNSILWEGGINSVFAANGSFPAITYSLVAGGFTGTGNSSANPAFVAPQPASAAPTTAGDYNITGCSAAVDAGQNTGNYTVIVDLAGNPRQVGTKVDMGGYEFQARALAGVLSGGNGQCICVGATVQLSSSVSGGAWTSLDPAKATVNASGVVTGVSYGNVAIRYTVTTNGCPAYVDTTICVNTPPYSAPPIVSVGSNLCVGETYTVSYTQANNISHVSLAFGDTTITGLRPNSGWIEARRAGTTTITLTATYYNGCVAAPVSIPVTIYALPSDSVTRSGRTLTAVQTGATYEWFKCTSNGNYDVSMRSYGRSYTPPPLGGLYGVLVSNAHCGVRSACYAVSPMSVSSIATEDWHLYPNPANGTSTLQTGSSVAKNIVIRDVTGKTLLEIQPTDTETMLDLEGFAPGLYLVTVAAGEGQTATLRLTVAGR